MQASTAISLKAGEETEGSKTLKLCRTQSDLCQEEPENTACLVNFIEKVIILSKGVLSCQPLAMGRRGGGSETQPLRMALSIYVYSSNFGYDFPSRSSRN